MRKINELGAPSTESDFLILEILGPVMSKLSSIAFYNSRRKRPFRRGPHCCCEIREKDPTVNIDVSISGTILRICTIVSRYRKVKYTKKFKECEDRVHYDFEMSDPGSITKIQDKLVELIDFWSEPFWSEP